MSESNPKCRVTTDIKDDLSNPFIEVTFSTLNLTPFIKKSTPICTNYCCIATVVRLSRPNLVHYDVQFSHTFLSGDGSTLHFDAVKSTALQMVAQINIKARTL